MKNQLDADVAFWVPERYSEPNAVSPQPPVAPSAQPVKPAEHVWNTPQQEITSAATSINARQMPATFKAVKWQPNTRNADIGGGRFDNATEHLHQHGVENVIYDPFNRPKEHNEASIAKIKDGQCHTATVNNVLNVIKEPNNRHAVIRQAANAIRPDGTAHFLIYEGNKSGQGSVTKAGWQEHRPAHTYLDEIGHHFEDVQRRGNLIYARKPRQVPQQYAASLWGDWSVERYAAVDTLPNATTTGGSSKHDQLVKAHQENMGAYLGRDLTKPLSSSRKLWKVARGKVHPDRLASILERASAKGYHAQVEDPIMSGGHHLVTLYEHRGEPVAVPARFQAFEQAFLEQYALKSMAGQKSLFDDPVSAGHKHDVSGEARDASGEWTAGSASPKRVEPDITGHNPDMAKVEIPKESEVSTGQPDIAGQVPSRKWEPITLENGRKAYKAPNGVVWVKAAAGGEVSPVTGETFRGGQLMPIHGLSVKQEKRPRSDKPGEASVVKPNENAKHREARPQWTPEEIEEERKRREEVARWRQIGAGPLGKLKWLGDNPNYKALTNNGINLKEWKEYAEQVGADGMKRLMGVLEPLVHKTIDDEIAKIAADPVHQANAASGFSRKFDPAEQAEWEKSDIRRRVDEDLSMFRGKKHNKEVPDSFYARQLLQEALRYNESVDGFHKLNAILADAAQPERHSAFCGAMLDYYAKRRSMEGQGLLWGPEQEAAHPREAKGTVGEHHGGEFAKKEVSGGGSNVSDAESSSSVESKGADSKVGGSSGSIGGDAGNVLTGTKEASVGGEQVPGAEPVGQESVGREAERPYRDDADQKVGRSRKNPVIEFATPIVGPSGAKLTSYEWKYTVEEDVDARGEERKRRVSDWEEAAENEHTGRQIVHHFHVTDKGGKGHVVSLESALELLGYTKKDKSGGAAKVRNISSAVKSRAKAQMELDQKRDVYQRLVHAVEVAKHAVSQMKMPPITVEQDGDSFRYHMGDAYQRVHVSPNLDTTSHYREKQRQDEYARSQVLAQWKRDRIDESVDPTVLAEAKQAFGYIGRPHQYESYGEISRVEKRIAKLDAKITAASAGEEPEVERHSLLADLAYWTGLEGPDLERYAAHDVSNESRDEGGKWTDGPGGQSKLRGVIYSTEDRIRDHTDREEGFFWNDRGEVVHTQTDIGTELNVPPDKLLLASGCVMTHNHPRGHGYGKDDPRRAGNSFSIQDVSMAIAGGLAELRAVSVGYRHSMKFPKGWIDREFNEFLSYQSEADRAEIMQMVNSGYATRGSVVWAEVLDETVNSEWKAVKSENQRRVNDFAKSHGRDETELFNKQVVADERHEHMVRIEKMFGWNYVREDYKPWKEPNDTSSKHSRSTENSNTTDLVRYAACARISRTLPNERAEHSPKASRGKSGMARTTTERPSTATVDSCLNRPIKQCSERQSWKSGSNSTNRQGENYSVRSVSCASTLRTATTESARRSQTESPIQSGTARTITPSRSMGTTGFNSKASARSDFETAFAEKYHALDFERAFCDHYKLTEMAGQQHLWGAEEELEHPRGHAGNSGEWAKKEMSGARTGSAVRDPQSGLRDETGIVEATTDAVAGNGTGLSSGLGEQLAQDHAGVSSSNESLVAAYQSGDKSALDRLITNNRGMVVSLARKWSKNQSDKDDLKQEGTIALMGAARGFKPELGNKFVTYAHLAVERAIRKAARNLKRGQSSGSSDEPSQDEAVSSGPEPVESAASQESGEGLRAALKQLPERDAEIVNLYYGVGGNRPLNVRQIGEKIGLSGARVHQILHGALDKLRDQHAMGLAHFDARAAFEREFYAAMFDPAKHPHQPAGAESGTGGQFAPIGDMGVVPHGQDDVGLFVSHTDHGKVYVPELREHYDKIPVGHKWMDIDRGTVEEKRKSFAPVHRGPSDEAVVSLNDIRQRLGNKYKKYLKDNEIDDEPESVAEYLEGEHGIRVRDDGRVEFDRLTRPVSAMIGNLPVVLIHHTTDALHKSIKKRGLLPAGDGVKTSNPHLNSKSGVYVTTEGSGSVVDGYHRVATGAHGGNPSSYEVETTIPELTPDPDDQDLSGLVGKQFILPRVHPSKILGLDKYGAREAFERSFYAAMGATGFDSLKHPRGQPTNKGEFAPKGQQLSPSAGVPVHKYEAGKKYHQPISEITHLPPGLLKPMDSGEVGEVSDEVAAGMKFDEPVDVSLFASGELRVVDGHHRVAAAVKRGMPSIRVNVQAINAKGGDIQRLIDQSQGFGEKPVAQPVPVPAPKVPQTETPEFTKWFGKSKVIDANGKPLRVFHGTVNELAGGSFDPERSRQGDNKYGFFFTESPDLAAGYAESDREGATAGPNIVPAYLSIRNPKEVTHDQYVRIYNRSSPEVIERKRRLEDDGFDGFVIHDYKDLQGTPRGKVFCAFHPEQIKSASGNRGSFNPKDPRINYAQSFESAVLDCYRAIQFRDAFVDRYSQGHDVSGEDRDEGGKWVAGSGFSRHPHLEHVAEIFEDLLRESPVEYTIAMTNSGEFLFSRRGNKDTTDFSKEEFDAMDGNAITHNHPEGLNYKDGEPGRNGMSFSHADISIAVACRMTQIRAVSVGYRHILCIPVGWSNDMVDRWMSVQSDEDKAKAIDWMSKVKDTSGKGKFAFAMFVKPKYKAICLALNIKMMAERSLLYGDELEQKIQEQDNEFNHLVADELAGFFNWQYSRKDYKPCNSPNPQKNSYSMKDSSINASVASACAVNTSKTMGVGPARHSLTASPGKSGTRRTTIENRILEIAEYSLSGKRGRKASESWKKTSQSTPNSGTSNTARYVLGANTEQQERCTTAPHSLTASRGKSGTGKMTTRNRLMGTMESSSRNDTRRSSFAPAFVEAYNARAFHDCVVDRYMSVQGQNEPPIPTGAQQRKTGMSWTESSSSKPPGGAPTAPVAAPVKAASPSGLKAPGIKPLLPNPPARSAPAVPGMRRQHLGEATAAEQKGMNTGDVLEQARRKPVAQPVAPTAASKPAVTPQTAVSQPQQSAVTPQPSAVQSQQSAPTKPSAVPPPKPQGGAAVQNPDKPKSPPVPGKIDATHTIQAGVDPKNRATINVSNVGGKWYHQSLKTGQWTESDPQTVAFITGKQSQLTPLRAPSVADSTQQPTPPAAEAYDPILNPRPQGDSNREVLPARNPIGVKQEAELPLVQAAQNGPQGERNIPEAVIPFGSDRKMSPQLKEAVESAVGEHSTDKQAFLRHVDDVYKVKSEHAQMSNNAMRQLMSQMGVDGGHKIAGLVKAARRASDLDAFQKSGHKLDEMAQLVENDPGIYAGMLREDQGEAAGSKQDVEQMLFQRLKEGGIVPEPKRHDPEVIKEALAKFKASGWQPREQNAVSEALESQSGKAGQDDGDDSFNVNDLEQPEEFKPRPRQSYESEHQHQQRVERDRAEWDRKHAPVEEEDDAVPFAQRLRHDATVSRYAAFFTREFMRERAA